MLAPWKISCDKSRQHTKKQRHHFADKGPSSQSYGFSSSHVWMWELNAKENWMPKNWCFQTLVLEKTLESPLDCEEIKPVNPKGNQCWMFIGSTDAEAEAPILATWCEEPTHQLIRKAPDAGKDWGQQEKVTTEDEMVRWHHQLIGHEFEQTLGNSEGQGSLACCSPWGHKESEHNWTTTTKLKVRVNSHIVSVIHTSKIWPQFSSVQFSRSVMSNSLQPHESQHTRPPCPSPTPGVHPDSRPSSQWYHPAISSSVIPFSSCPQSLPASESFPSTSTQVLKLIQIPFFSACVYSPSVLHPKLALWLHTLTWSFWLHDLICAYYFAPKWNSISVHYHTTYETEPLIILFLILQVS